MRRGQVRSIAADALEKPVRGHDGRHSVGRGGGGGGGVNDMKRSKMGDRVAQTAEGTITLVIAGIASLRAGIIIP